MKENMYDVIIVGGGIMGCTAAYYLITGDDQLNIAVIERDPTYSQASTTLSMANVRIQFSLQENIQISQYASETFETFADVMAVEGIKPGIDYRREGNLFMVKKEDRKAAQNALSLQKHLGCPVEWWSIETIKQHFPLYQPGGLAGGTFGPADGHLDPYSLLMGYKKKAKTLGVTFISDEVSEITRNFHQVTGVKLTAKKPLGAGMVINCAGAWAAPVALTAGVKLPIRPRKRQVFVLDTAVKPEGPLPLTILPSGLYFRTDTGGQILLGKSTDDDPAAFDFTWDQERFIDHLWLELVTFVPLFDRLKLVRGWAGLYAENTFDGNAILGEWPECKGFYLANGFSGHGLQQAPAVGRYLSELIFQQKPMLDLSIFNPQRILDNKPLSETGLV
ncbi:MAG: FAD-binding oxidoreductase [Candidatus Aminicenantes bacterium]|nr:MAG: FAD-binding oxidoreductase [Candidatus Aminicenantes bacterium]